MQRIRVVIVNPDTPSADSVSKHRFTYIYKHTLMFIWQMLFYVQMHRVLRAISLYKLKLYKRRLY